MKEVTFNQAVKLLNGMVSGLGDLFKENFDPSYSNKRSDRYFMSDWIAGSFSWFDSVFRGEKMEDGGNFWGGLDDLFLEMEDGAGIKK